MCLYNTCTLPKVIFYTCMKCVVKKANWKKEFQQRACFSLKPILPKLLKSDLI